MGSKLIIKNADFSANAITDITPTWYFNYAENEMNSGRTFSTATFYMKGSEITTYGLEGKTVQYVKCYCSAAGTIKIANVNISGASATKGTEYSYTVTAGMNVIRLTDSISLSSTKSICFTGSGILNYYNQDDSVHTGWHFLRVGTTADNYANCNIPIDIGYIAQ